MASDLAACLARLAAELASDSIQLAIASPNSTRSTWRSLTTRTRSSADPPTSLSVERRLQRFATLDDFRRALLNASSHDIHQIQEVAINTIMTNAFALGDTLTFRQSIAQCFVLLLSRSDIRFTDDALGRMLDSIGGSNTNPMQVLPAFISTTLECIRQIAVQYPARMVPFHSQLTKAVKRLMRSANSNVRSCALQCLYSALPSDTLHSDLARIIAKAIADRSNDVRAVAASCVPKLLNPITILVQLLEDPDFDVQQAAVNAFSDVSLSHDSAIAKLLPLKPLLEKSRSSAIVALTRCLPKAVIDPGQMGTFSVELLLQLLDPISNNSARISAIIIVKGLLLRSNLLSRSNLLKSLLHLSSQKTVKPWILSTCLDVAYASIHLLGSELASELEDNLLELLLSSLSHPLAQIRLQSAATLQQLAKNRPAQTTTIARILQNVAAIHIAEVTVSIHDVRNMAAALSAMHGHCHALAALVSISTSLNCGIPDSIIGDLLKTATSLAAFYTGDVCANSTFTMVCAESAWVLIDALLLHGVDSNQLSQTLFPLWRAYMKADRAAHSFAKSVSIADSNSTAQVEHAVAAIHIRRWALTALRTLVKCVGSDGFEDCTQVLKPIAAILNEAMIVAQAVKSVRDSWLDHGLVHAEFQAYKAILLDVFSWLPLSMFQSRHIPLLHLCVSEFASRSAPVSRHLELSLTKADYVLDGDRVDDILTQEYFNGPDFHSQSSSYSFSSYDAVWSNFLEDVPLRYRFLQRFALLPSAQRVVDASIRTFSLVFKLQQPQHQIQLLTHFHTIQAQSSDDPQITPPVLNVTAALLCTLQDLVHSQHDSTDISVRNVLAALLRSLGNSHGGLVRRGACECFGLLCRLEDSTFTSALMADQRDVLQSNTQQSASSVTSSVFTIVNIHRHVGVIGTIQFLPFTIMTLQSLLEHTVEPLRTYVLHSLWCLVDISGTNFSPYARSSLDIILLQILSDQQNISKPLYRIIARLIRSLLEILGPELSQDPAPLRKCEWLWRSCAQAAESESVECIQQFVFWASESVSLSQFIDRLKSLLLSSPDPDVVLALVLCVKQIAMKDYNMVIDHEFDIGLLALLEHETDPNIQKMISAALETIVIVSSAPDRWLDLAKVILVNGRLPSTQPAPAEQLEDVHSDPAGPVSPVSWRTVACATACLAMLIDSAQDFTQRLREVANLVCRSVSSSDDAIRAAGLHGLGALLRRYWSVADPNNTEDCLLHWDLPQIKAAIRSVMVLESSAMVKEQACVSCAELLISNLMRDDDVAVRRFLDLLCAPFSDQGRHLALNFSDRTCFCILCSHLTALSRVALSRTLCDPDLTNMLRQLLIAAVQDRIIVCGIHDIRSCTSRLFSPVYLSRNAHERDWSLYMRCLAKMTGQVQVAIRATIGVALQYMHMYLETVSNQESEHEPEIVAKWAVQSISTIYESDAGPDTDLTLHVLSSLSVVCETCSLGRLGDVVNCVISIIKSAKGKSYTEAQAESVRGSLRKIVRLAFSRCIGYSVLDTDLLDACLELVHAVMCDACARSQDAYTISTWAKYCIQSMANSSKSSFVVHSIVDYCANRSEPEFSHINEAVYIESFRLLSQADVYDSSKASGVICMMEAVLCAACTRKSFQSQLIGVVTRCLRSDTTCARFTLGLQLTESMLKYSDSRFHHVLTSIAAVLIQVASSYKTSLLLSLVAATTIMIEQISKQPGKFLAHIIIPFYMKLDHPDTQSYVTLFASAIGSNLREAVQSLSSAEKIDFQRCLERSAAASSTAVPVDTKPTCFDLGDKKPIKKCKIKKGRSKLTETSKGDVIELS